MFDLRATTRGEKTHKSQCMKEEEEVSPPGIRAASARAQHSSAAMAANQLSVFTPTKKGFQLFCDILNLFIKPNSNAPKKGCFPLCSIFKSTISFSSQI